MYQISIHWEGPLTLAQVIKKYNDGGDPPRYDGKDYGLYQIYGRHILDDPKKPPFRSLLYIGKATEQTFARRFRDHEHWIANEWTQSIRIHLGRVESLTNQAWEKDVPLAERILIYTYSPHYNSNLISDRPNLAGHEQVAIVHKGNLGRLRKKDVVPKDWV
jgi:hypothetical protein